MPKQKNAMIKEYALLCLLTDREPDMLEYIAYIELDIVPLWIQELFEKPLEIE